MIIAAYAVPSLIRANLMLHLLIHEVLIRYFLCKCQLGGGGGLMVTLVGKVGVFPWRFFLGRN